MLKSFFSNKGFTLVSTIVAAGLMGGLAVALLNLTEQQNKVTKSGEEKLEIISAISMINNYISKEENCTESVRNNIMETDQVTIKQVKSDGTIVDRYGHGQSISNRLKISSIILKNENSIPDGEFGAISMLVQFKEKKSSKTYLRKINLFGKVNGNQVSECSSIEENRVVDILNKACDSFGEYDNSIGKCRPRKDDGTTVVCTPDQAGFTRFNTTELELDYCNSNGTANGTWEPIDNPYAKGQWYSIKKMSYVQADPDGKFSALQINQVDLPFKACEWKIDGGFDDGGFAVLYDGNSSSPFMKVYKNFWGSCHRGRSSHTVCRNELNDWCDNLKEPSLSADGTFKWCQYPAIRGAGAVSAQVEKTIDKGTTISIYSAHSIGDGSDSHNYNLQARVCRVDE